MGAVNPNPTLRPDGPIAWAVGVALLLALGVLMAGAALRVAQPRPLPDLLEPFDQYDRKAVRDAMTAASVERELRSILAHGNRFVGNVGLDAARHEVKQAILDAGLELIEQPVSTVAPVTLQRRIEDASGAALAGVEIYPLLPNHAQPIVTPDGGVEGELLWVTDEVLATRGRFDDCIALLDLRKPSKRLGLDWARYAELGFRALVVSHSEGLERADWSARTFMPLVGDVPINYPRLVATAGLFEHAGRSVRLHVRCAYRNVPDPNLVGVLRSGATPSSRAVVVVTHLDAPSPLPDLSPGVQPAINLAAQLALMRGLTAYRSQLRADVVFVFVSGQMFGQSGTYRLLSTLGFKGDTVRPRKTLTASLDDHQASLAKVGAILSAFDRAGFLEDPAATNAASDALPAEARDLLAEQVRYVLNDRLLQYNRQMLRARVAFLRQQEDVNHPSYAAFLASKQRTERLSASTGYSLSNLLLDKAAMLREMDFATLLRRRLEQLRSHHLAGITEAEAGLRLNELFGSYRDLVVVSASLAAAPAPAPRQTLSFVLGPQHGEQTRRHGSGYNNFLLAVRSTLEPDSPVDVAVLADNHEGRTASQNAGLVNLTAPWVRCGYAGFTLVHTDRTAAYELFHVPLDLPWMRDMNAIAPSLAMFGETVLSLAFGNGRFESDAVEPPISYGGRVYVSGIGRSLLPNFPLSEALVMTKGYERHYESGILPRMILWTDAYGRYALPDTVAGLQRGTGVPGYSPNAFGYDASGRIALATDEGAASQNVYRSKGIDLRTQAGPHNIVTFEAAPVTMFDLINPQSLQPYSSVELIEAQSLTPLPTFNAFTETPGLFLRFVRPDDRFFVELKAGSPDNELVQQTRAFMLGVENDSEFQYRGREVDGPGYLAAHATTILDVPKRVAASMQFLNGQRLELQNRHRMADERTNRFHQRGEELLEAQSDPNLTQLERTITAQNAVTYATLNHPVLRASIVEAVMGIVWYLGLLVPFAFFFEKLVFGYTDIRKQLLAHALIFLSVFALLKLLHPAFELIQSSLMILLGFVIMLISSAIMVVFSGKFRENLEGLAKQRGVVAGAQVNTMGVIGTAFALGLNNMHRRRVRTGLTCATLVLITFAMICFINSSSDVVDDQIATGRAAYQGLLVRDDNLKPIADAELFALRTRYGHRFDLAERRMVVASYNNYSRQLQLPELKATYASAGNAVQSVGFSSILFFDRKEPLAGSLRFLTQRSWWPHEEPDSVDSAAPMPVMLPSTMAQRLGLTPAEVDERDVLVDINGKAFVVWSIFDPASLEALRDVDGRSLLPFDAQSMPQLQVSNNAVLAVEPYVSVPAEELVIMLDHAGIRLGENIGPRRTSVALWLRDRDTGGELPYKQARQEIDFYLEQSGRVTHYGLEGVSYRGQRARQTSFAGVLELIIPLVIAALTVLNTMRGSVYERREEIFVYNAVGIAPRFVFAMFFAEAFVYAVVGSVLGYVLSQGVGKVLTTLELTGGLNMTFTSLNTVTASLAMMLCVFLSTLFPALSAMRIAAPAEDAGWTLPEPQGDDLSMLLPFTFDPTARVAVLEFLERFFLDHGEGSSGTFFCSPPRMAIHEQTDPLDHEGYIPGLQCTVWLKPFDLGVSQRLTIALPTDPQTREYIARLTLTRLSGTRESWVRLNKVFLGRLRQHFLHWRAVGSDEKREMFTAAADKLRTAAATTLASGVALA